MAHFGVVAPAFLSHYTTLSALAGALVERGHRVTFLHRPDAAAYVRDGRLGFHAVGNDTHPPGSLDASLKLAAHPGSPLGLRRVIDDMAQSTTMLCETLPAALQALQIDAVLADQMEAAGGLVAEALGLPFVSVACALPVNREPGVPLPVMPFGYGTDERSLKMVEGSTRVYDWMMGPHRRAVEAQARRFGIPVRGMLHEFLSPLAQVSQTVAEFEFPRHQLPPQFHHVGPLRPLARNGATIAGTRTGALPEIDPDRPFVFASLGTMQGGRLALFERIARACRQAGVQLLLAHCGGLDARQEAVLLRTGATWVTDFAPQLAALERADAVISHAGWNTIMDAIATGTPMLALPIAFDHPGGAARVRYAGTGIQASARFTRAGTLAGHLRRLLDDPGYKQRLAPLAAAVARAGGTARAADIVESALGLAPPQRAMAAGTAAAGAPA
ncbi:glycosyltransferase family 1 protein [Massilia forsythiae]|uniref:Glycosyltransferase family 1 protein n=1 Tax=Massilia forsythiae TaxID=2728020 RepID=A0A7Z2VUE9_9BURK|nr:glycosyltransferase [Massilia forsythiae]QJD99358.1 glycosyltransferase family 1 protein [Massilia forsythiae]